MTTQGGDAAEKDDERSRLIERLRAFADAHGKGEAFKVYYEATRHLPTKRI